MDPERVMKGRVNQPPPFLGALCGGFGHERCAELKRKGLAEAAGVAPVFTICERPRLHYFPRFLFPEETDALKSLAEPMLGPSGVGSGKNAQGGKKRGRTSDGARLPRGNHI
eukprot:gene45025-58519_t